MKFAIVHPSLKVKGGAENVVVWLAEGLVKRGHDVTVFTTDYDKDFYGDPQGMGFNIELLPLGGYTISPLHFIYSGYLLRNKLASFDVINPHNFPAYIWCYIAKIVNPKLKKITWFCEEPVRFFYRNIIDEHVRLLTSTQVTAKTTKKEKPISNMTIVKDKKIFVLIKNRIRVWKNARNIQIAKRMDMFVVPHLDNIITNSQFIASNIKKIFNIIAEPCLLGIPPNRFKESNDKITYQNYVVTVARLNLEKNIENCIRAVKLLVDEDKFMFDTYFIAGTGPLEKDIKQLITTLGLGKKVVLLGFVTEDKLADLYRNAKLVVYLSLDETYGLVFPEAAYYKKPVIGPNHGGPTELIIDGMTGLQVDPLSPQSIADGIDKIGHMDYRKIGENAYRNYCKNLTFEAFLDRFLIVINLKNEIS